MTRGPARRRVPEHLLQLDPDTPGTCGVCHLVAGHASHLTTPPPVDPAVAAAEARRLGERRDD